MSKFDGRTIYIHYGAAVAKENLPGTVNRIVFSRREG